ncbi:hypothetical protein ACEUZ9_000433 [Paracoccus litorisediminis]|uniref:hypothetical protein n=1 Tax=Paracoccus litorisediminis TaxID=2006130 RepID=UPI00372F26FE
MIKIISTALISSLIFAGVANADFAEHKAFVAARGWLIENGETAETTMINGKMAIEIPASVFGATDGEISLICAKTPTLTWNGARGAMSSQTQDVIDAICRTRSAEAEHAASAAVRQWLISDGATAPLSESVDGHPAIAIPAAVHGATDGELMVVCDKNPAIQWNTARMVSAPETLALLADICATRS